MLIRTMVNAVAAGILEFALVTCCVDALSNMALDLLACGPTVVIIRGVTSIRADALLDVDVNVFAGVMAEVTFVMPAPIDNCSCLAAFECRSMPALDCDRVLQAWMPSYHVWPSLALPTTPQIPNQEPPRPQQLTFPDFLTKPHRGHTKSIAAVVTARVYT